MKIEITGGTSSKNIINLSTDEFMATAHSYPNNHISCKIRRRPKFARFILKYKNLPWPRLVWFVITILTGLTKDVLIPFFVFLLIVTFTFIIFPPPVALQAWGKGYANLSNWIYLAIFVLLVLVMKFYNASWHGAEHMTVAAYDRTGSVKIKDIAKESPINESCGGRFTIPFLVLPTIVSCFSSGWNSVIFFFIALECIFWIDKLWGLEKIPITSQAAFMLQKYITTKTPGEQEMRTAQRALKKLIAAHNSLS